MRRVRLSGGERPLRVADHLVAGDRDERPLGTVAVAGHVTGEPVGERLDLELLLAWNVGASLPVDVVEPVDEIGPLGPGDDRDARRRGDRKDLAGEVERHLELAPDLDEAALLREGEALLVAELDMREQRLPARGRRPCRELGEERRAEPAPAALGGDERPDEGLRMPRLLHAEADRDELAAVEREQVHLLRVRHPGADVLDRDRVVGDELVAEREPALELGVVAGRADLGHPATIRPNTYGGDLVSTWSVLRQSCKPRSPVGLVNPPGNQVSADNELALAA